MGYVKCNEVAKRKGHLCRSVSVDIVDPASPEGQSESRETLALLLTTVLKFYFFRLSTQHIPQCFRIKSSPRKSFSAWNTKGIQLDTVRCSWLHSLQAAFALTNSNVMSLVSPGRWKAVSSSNTVLTLRGSLIASCRNNVRENFFSVACCSNLCL